MKKFRGKKPFKKRQEQTGGVLRRHKSQDSHFQKKKINIL